MGRRGLVDGDRVLDGDGRRVVGEAVARHGDVEDVARVFNVVAGYDPADPYTEDGSLPVPMHKMGIRGLSYKKYDLTMCTYCSIVNGAILGSIAFAWKGTPWDDVEILTGKVMQPTPGRKKTVLIGKCIYTANKDNPDINEMIAVKGCPPQPKAIVKALHRAGIPVDAGIFEKLDEPEKHKLSEHPGRDRYNQNIPLIRLRIIQRMKCTNL